MNKVHDRETSGSKVRGSLNRDMTPNKMGDAALGSNQTITAVDTSIQNMRQGVRNIKTPQSSQQNQQLPPTSRDPNNPKPTRLSLKMLSQSKK